MSRIQFIILASAILLFIILGYSGIVYILSILMGHPDNYFLYYSLVIILLLTIPYIILKIIFHANRAWNEPELHIKDLPKDGEKLQQNKLFKY